MRLFRKKRRAVPMVPAGPIDTYPSTELEVLRRPRINLSVIRKSGKWGVMIHATGWLPCITKAGATEVGRIIGRTILASGGLAELSIHKANGRIADKETYGDDPREVPG